MGKGNVPDHLAYKLLPRRLLRIEQAQQCEQLPLIRSIGDQLGLLVDVDEEDTEVASRAALAGVQERGGDVGEDVDGGGPVFGFDVAGGDDAGLLLCFVELAFGDSGGC